MNPDLPLPAFRKRDRARRELVALLEEIFAGASARGRRSEDLFAVLRRLRDAEGRPRFSTDVITGMFISMMFAGHHTTSVSASWALIELLRHPDWLKQVVTELDALYADGREVSYQALREIPLLESALKESLRLHPPLILLMRKVMHDFQLRPLHGPGRQERRRLDRGLEPHARALPGSARATTPRAICRRAQEDAQPFAWIPFGAGRHRCVGAAFAMMQLKAIFAILLRRYELELAQPPESYRNDHSKMVVSVRQPCRVRYRRRTLPALADPHARHPGGTR